MKVAGANEYKQLCADSNNKSASYYPVISPPVESRLDISKTMSYSVYRDHAVWITRDMKGYAIGDNSNGRIYGKMSLKKLSTEESFIIYDNEGKPCDLFSAVCGQWYTLYMVQPQGATDYKLAYVAYNKNEGTPLFLDIGGRKPIGLFGGESKAAAIDSKGAIIIITETLFDSPDQKPQIAELPGNEQAICLACCDCFIAALSSNGRVYLSAFKKSDNKFSDFVEVPTLKGIKFTHVSGTFEHCLAVSEDGRVFGIGSNSNGVLGLGSKLKKADKFREIKNLSNQKIKAAFAGFDESLFITENGKILSCGNNYCGQLLSAGHLGQESVFTPKETIIKEGATFCIAGYGLSAVFVGLDPPPYSPNKIISTDLLITKKNAVADFETQTQAQMKNMTTESKVLAEVNSDLNANKTESEIQAQPLMDQANIQARTLAGLEKQDQDQVDIAKNKEKLSIEQSTPGFDIELKATENVPTAPPEVDEKKSKCCLLI